MKPSIEKRLEQINDALSLAEMNNGTGEPAYYDAIENLGEVKLLVGMMVESLKELAGGHSMAREEAARTVLANVKGSP